MQNNDLKIDRIPTTPDALDLESPGRHDYWVRLEHDSIWGEHLIPLTVFVGPEATPGKGMVVFGGTHGNEYEGPVVVKHLLGELRLEDVLGRILLIPVLNVSAFASGARDSVDADHVNLNRAFVDGAGMASSLAGITHRIAAFVRQSIWPHVHLVLDLHAGGRVARFARCSSFHPVDDPEQGRLIEQTARWFGTPLVMIYQNRTPGLMVSEAERLGKITVGTELGWGAAVSAQGVHLGRHGVLAAAIHHGLMRGSIEPTGHHADGTQKRVEIVDPACFVPAPFPGLYEPLLECGVQVEQGQTVGLLHDFHRIDAPPAEIRAGLDGVVVAQAWDARVEQGQHILVVGRVIG